MNDRPLKRAVSYSRYSSAQQRDVSIEQQQRDIRAFAEREGYTIVHEYADHAKSGFHNIENRTEFMSMIQASATGAFDTVIAWKVDRFGRNRRESAIYKGQLADNGVSVVYAMEPIPDGAAGVLTEGMLEALAEWYSRTISENTKRGLHDNAIKGLYNGHLAYGYDRTPDNRFSVNEAEAAIVRRIFDLYSQGHSFADIVRAMEADGIMSKCGKPFQKSTVLYILRNENYIGVYHWSGVRIEGAMPRIIDDDLFEQCQAMRKKTFRHKEKAPEPYYLSGKCTCGLCGAPIYGHYGSGRNHKRYLYYVCSNVKSHQCTARYNHKRDLEAPLFDFIFNKILNKSTITRYVRMIYNVLKANQKTSPAQKLEAELKDVTRKIDNITRAICDGIWTKQTAAMLERLSAKEEELKNSIAFHKAADQKIISEDRIRFLLEKNMEGKYNDPDHLKALSDALINSVVVYDHWMEVAINVVDDVGRIPPDSMPPLDRVPDANRFGFRTVKPPSLYVAETYPVIVFKIAV